MSQSSVFDQRLDRLASGVKMARAPKSVPSAAKGRSGGGGNSTMAAPGFVPKFRSSPLPFSANLHVTPQPRRVSGQQGTSSVVKKAASTTGKRVRGGAKSGRAGGLSVSTGFGRAAAPSTPSAPGFETFHTSVSTKRDRYRKSTALPSMPMMMMP